MREIVIDTETTGLDPFDGHRLVEIGCIELVNRIPSGQFFHCYVNPERDIPAEAYTIHGIDNARVKDEKIFADIADELIAFLGDSPLVAHNALFDLGFLNAEIERCGRVTIPRDRVIDTLLLARRKYPGAANRLDDLCARYRIDSSRRVKHGALLDAELLAEVYLELIEARQASLVLIDGSENRFEGPGSTLVRLRPEPLPSRLSAAERAAHRSFIRTLGAGSIWTRYLATSEDNPGLPDEAGLLSSAPTGPAAGVPPSAADTA